MKKNGAETGARIARGLLAGLAGGLAGSVVKALGEKLYDPRTRGRKSPPVVLAEKVAGHRLNKAQRQGAEQGIHYFFGGATGAIYGVAAEFLPIARVGYGSIFGVVLQVMTHESLVPAAGLGKPATEQPAREHTSELFTHVLYGMTTEAVRAWTRRVLDCRVKRGCPAM